MSESPPTTPALPSEPASPAGQSGGVSITGVQGDVIAGGDIVGRDKITTTIITDEKAYDVAGLPNPYLGLRSFTYAERTRYAGRERAVEEAVAKLTVPGEQRALLFITGASGSGKSSFAQAGLVPALEAYYAQRGQLVRHAVFRPGAHPLAARDDALKQLSVGDDGRPSQTIPVLILDQFEELFSQSQPEERASLFAWLAELPPFATAPRHLIVTVRSDYLNELFEVKPLWEAAKAGVELRAMQADELKDAILRPVQSRYPSGEKRLEPALVDRLAQDAAGQATYLPLVQVTLEELWRKGRLALSYYGTLSDAIKQRADQVFQFVDYDGAAPHQPRAEADQAAVLELFLSLVSVSPDDDPRRDVRLSRVTSAFTPEQRRLTADLSQARLLSVEDEPNGETVNIIHETLIRNWDRLRDGVNVRRQHLRQRGRFEQQLQLWLADDRSDDYLLLTNVQLAEARELDQAGDIALRNQNAQELLRRSIEHAEAERQRELEEAQKLAESERKRAEEQAQANRRMQARNRVITLVSVIALVAAISAGLFGIAAGFFGIQANRNAATAEAANAAALAQQTTAEANATEAFQQAQLARAGRLAAESVARLDNQLDLALLLGLEALRRQATVETRGTLLAGNTHRPQLITFLHGQGGQGIRSVAFGSNGQTLASSDLSGRVMLWHVPTRQSLGTFADESGTLFKIAFTPDGRRLVTAGVMGLAVWDVPTRQKVVSLAQDAESHFALSPDGKRLAWSACTRQEGTFSCGEQAVYISDLEANRILTSTSVVSDRVDSLAFSPDGRILAAIILPRSGTIVRTLFLWEAATLQPRDPLPGSEGVVARDIAFSPDGEWLIAAETQGVRLWNMRTRQPMAASQFFSQDSATRVAISPDGAWLAVGYADGKVVLASLPDVEAGVSRQAPVELFGHTQFVNSLAFSPDSALLASGAEDSQILLWDLTSQQALGQPLARQRNFSGLGEALAYSADGQTMALGGRGIELWNTATRQRVYQSVQDAGTLFETDTAVSPDGKILAAGLCESEEESQCANGEIRLLDVASGELRGPPLTGFAGAADGLLFSPDGKILASSHCAQAGGPTGRECALSEVRLWRVQTLDSAGPPLSLGAGRVTGLAFNREGDVLAVAGCPPGALNTADSENCSGGGIRLWNLNTREPLGGWLTDFPSQVDQLAFSPDGAALAASSCGHATIDAAGQPVACHSGIVRLWDVGDRQPLGSPLVDEAGPVTSLAFGPTGDVLATGGCAQFVVSEQLPDGDCVAGAVQLWDIQASKPIGARWVEPVGFITALAFSPDGQRLAAAGCGQKTTDTVRGQSWCEQAEISIWETQRGELVREPLKPEGASNLYRLAYSADGAHLQALYTSTLFTWETQTWQPIDQASVNLFVRSEADTVSSLAFSPKGNMLATGGCLTAAFPCLEGSIQLWDITDLQSPRLIGQPFGQHTNYVSSLAFSSDGQYLASGGWDEIVKVWDISDPAAPALVGQPLAGSGSVNSLVFSPDNKALVVANGEIQVWDPNTGKRLGQRLEAFHLSALSHDGRRLATASSDPNLIVLWDFSNPSAPVELGRLTGHTDTIRSLAFSPDGALLVTASEDKTIRLWDLTTFQALGPALTISRESVQAVAFSPDGALMVSAGESVRLWDLRLSAWRERACRIANRNLTQSEWRQFIGTEPYQKTCSDFPDGE